MWVARENRVFQPTNPRFAYSTQFKKTNFKFGDDSDCILSTYLHDYNNSDRSSDRPKQPQITLDIVTPSSEKLVGGARADPKQKKTALQKTNITFGNDDNSKVTTAYQNFTQLFPHGQILKRKTCPPPELAEILPLPTEKAWRSTLRNDYAHFGNQVTDSYHSDRVSELDRIRAMHSRDCVGQGMLGIRKKMLTRSMVDYRAPVDQIRGNIKQLMVESISPSVRQDSIWLSVNGGGASKLTSEHKNNFTWPLAMNRVQRFSRGHFNNKAR